VTCEAVFLSLAGPCDGHRARCVGAKVGTSLLLRQRHADGRCPFLGYGKRAGVVILAQHGCVSFEVDYTAIEKARSAAGDRVKQEEGFRLTYLPFVLRALATAIRAFPLVNSRFENDGLVVRREINLGVAVDLSHEGLLVPLIKRADGLNLLGLARQVHELAMRARSGCAKLSDLADGTFTVTNPGPTGTLLSVPIINPPQTAILVTDGVAKRPSVVTLADGTDVIAVRSKGFIGLSLDHRAFDGVYAAQFLTAVKRLLEQTNWLDEVGGQ
jgi:2-oxoglutarate dehydrogenase E2 component (dihydrolipoamide succinyltransferase)